MRSKDLGSVEIDLRSNGFIFGVELAFVTKLRTRNRSTQEAQWPTDNLT
jgi:hypothetical protein